MVGHEAERVAAGFPGEHPGPGQDAAELESDCDPRSDVAEFVKEYAAEETGKEYGDLS